MNENVKAVFKILGVEPNEAFGVCLPDGDISYFKHRINENLNIEWFDDEENCWRKNKDSEYLKNLLTGEYTIIKQSKFTEAEQKIIETYKLLGYNYIAKDFNDAVWVYVDAPLYNTSLKIWYIEVWNHNTPHLLPSCVKFNSLSYDELYHING